MTGEVKFPDLTDEQAAVHRELMRDRAVWDQRAIAEALGVRYQTVRMWRAEGILPGDDAPAVKLAGSLTSPRWYAGTVRLWAFRTGRIAWDGTPLRKPPPGRPVRRWESIACEWVTVVSAVSREDGTVMVEYPGGSTQRVGAWILRRSEDEE